MRHGGSDIDFWRVPWAKCPYVKPGERQYWLPLHNHATDAGALAQLIWDEWLGVGVRHLIASDFGGDEALARAVVVLAAALHDTGKCTPAFAGQASEAKVWLECEGFEWQHGSIAQDSRALPHAIAGYVLVAEYLRSVGVPDRHAEAFAVVVGGHHGVPPDDSQIADAIKAHRFLGGGLWAQSRAALIDHVLVTLDLESAVSALRRVRLSDASQMLITAIVIMADWIASTPELFPLVPSFEQVDESPFVRAERGWRRLGLPALWQPSAEALTADVTHLLQSRFEVDFEANAMQRTVVESARAMSAPGLLLIEAVMGAGKTEAALLAAEVLAYKFGRTGIFYGLPTRATTDAMFDRALTWWRNAPGTEPAERGIVLRHSSAWLNPGFRALPRRYPRSAPASDDQASVEWEPVDVDRDSPGAPTWDGRGRAQCSEVVAHSWTSGRKKASFADSVIATIDHELLASLATRHVVLRHLGLARQVVILDELHACDLWMAQYLERTLEWLGRYGTPVIALSATLPPAQRQRLVDAYETGRRAGLPAEWTEPTRRVGALAATPRRVRSSLPEVPERDEYPLITWLDAGQVRQATAPPPPSREVAIDWLADGLEDLERALDPVLVAGGCALVVCNTVGRAVQRYRHLRGRWGDRVTLAHSRYVVHDRSERDTWLRSTFGPEPGDRSGRVVVATQVAEQSLDVDFDLLVTDLAPVDLLLQRIGRLHRHPRPSRPPAAYPSRCLVTGLGVPLSDSRAPRLDPGGATVYGEYLLYRTAGLVAPLLVGNRSLTLPKDVPDLVRHCYGERVVGPEAWQSEIERAYQKALGAEAADKSGADTYRLVSPGAKETLVGLLSASAGEAETSAGATKAVRKDDGGFEVIVLEEADDGLRLLPHLDDGRRIPTDVRPDFETVRLLALSMVRVPGSVTRREADMDAVLSALAATYFPAWQRDPVLSGQLVLLLDSDGYATAGPFRFSYDPEAGLEVLHG